VRLRIFSKRRAMEVEARRALPLQVFLPDPLSNSLEGPKRMTKSLISA
jgi:hypothetical protein